jgi:hypothetical protein
VHANKVRHNPVEAESAKFEAEQPTKSTDSVVVPEPWKQIFPPQICQVLLIQKETHPGPGGADHLGKHFLTDLWNHRLRLSVLAKVGQQQEHPRQPLFARIKVCSAPRSLPR